MNQFEEFFHRNDHRPIHKSLKYFEIYERFFKRFKGERVRLLEIGVWLGGSLQMWKNYFGNSAKIYGIDINPDCKQYEEEQVKIFIGSQSDSKFLKTIISEVGGFDIVIDDGSHLMGDLSASFENLFGHLSEGGIYLVEDTCTSYWDEYGGGYKKPNTFIEYSKNLIDLVNAYSSRSDDVLGHEFATMLESISYFENVIVFEKTLHRTPTEGCIWPPVS